MQRRTLLMAGVAASVAPGLRAQAAWPVQPVRLMIAFPPGGPTDLTMRALAENASKLLGQPVVIENRPGAGGTLPAQALQQAKPDGYTLAQIPLGVFRLPYTTKISWDPVKDITYILGITGYAFGVVVPTESPIKTWADFVAWAKANPGKLNFANFGNGTSSHIYATAFARTVGIDVVHVPYKGTADAVKDLLEGRVQAYFDAAPTAIQNAQTGRIKMVAVAAPNRMKAAPDVSTFNEQSIPGLDLTSWVAIVGPAKMQPELVARINAALVQVLNSPDVREFYARGAWETSPGSPAELAQDMRMAYDRWGAMIKAIGFEKQ